MGAHVCKVLQALRRGWRNDAGSVMILFSLAAPMLLAGAGVAIDYIMLSTTRADLQNAADGAALAAAREFRLGNTSPGTVASVAGRFAHLALADARREGAVSASADMSAKTVTVAIRTVARTTVMHLFGATAATVSVSATARVVGGAPICVVGLAASENFTISLDKNARLEAPNCAIYSNSTQSQGLNAKNNATIKAAFICSAGGKSSPGPGSFSPSPQTDCPVLADPLATRPAPPVAGCSMTDAVIKTNTTLFPGVYCGGLSVSAGASVTLSPGVYVIKDGPFSVGGGGGVMGANVGFYLSGKDARLDFQAASTISLTAPNAGDMAGMLIFEDRASPVGQVHEILSDNARNLLGTIYLPRGRLHVAANRPVASESAYTIVVAHQFTLSEGPTMVLNTNYSSTNIPVPAGVGPSANAPRLTQ